MSKILEELKKKLNSMTKKELNNELEKLKHYNEIGPTVDEYFENLKKCGLLPKDF